MAGIAGARHSSAFLNFQCRRTPEMIPQIIPLAGGARQTETSWPRGRSAEDQIIGALRRHEADVKTGKGRRHTFNNAIFDSSKAGASGRISTCQPFGQADARA